MVGQGGYRENYNRGNSNSGNGSNNEYRGHTYGFNRSTAEPSTTVVIKGLPVQTTEPTVLMTNHIFDYWIELY